jgi:hypothetical protein
MRFGRALPSSTAKAASNPSKKRDFVPDPDPQRSPCCYADCPFTDKRPPIRDDEAYGTTRLPYANLWIAQHAHTYCDDHERNQKRRH